MKPRLPDDKEMVSGIAKAALAGIVATPSLNEWGQRTLILTRGAWTREVSIEQLPEVLAEAKEQEGTCSAA